MHSEDELLSEYSGLNGIVILSINLGLYLGAF